MGDTKVHVIKRFGIGLLLAGSTIVIQAYEFSGNISVSNNYLWRGLTQSTDEPAISGGIDVAFESGIYVGTWISNVQYAADDAFSYENDLYIGYAGEYNDISYDIGYLYYNYNEQAGFDFAEIYASLGYAGFSVSASLLAHTQAEESAGQAVVGRDYDYGFGEAYYISLDYSFGLPDMEGTPLEGVEFGLHAGYHDGDFVDGFNFADGTFNYFDYAASVSKSGFSLMISGTDLEDSPSNLNNDSMKFVLSYGLDF
jgi:uncharacterized protein (TIGR02001 family)